MLYLIQMGLEQEQAFTIMEKVRKGKGLTAKDVQAMRACHVPEWYEESCQKIKYLFPKAHAVAYVMMAFRIAWFKVYYPAAFYAGQFSCRADEVDADLVMEGPDRVDAVIGELERKIANRDYTAKDEKTLSSLELVREMFLRGLRFHPVDLEKSPAWHFLPEPDGRSLRLPLVSIQGLGLVVAQNIVAAREKRSFFSVEDLKRQAKVSKTVIEALKKHGALEGMTEYNQQVLFS
jgi:DNA polymerase-3 subunit alpha (Gram-positive type)